MVVAGPRHSAFESDLISAAVRPAQGQSFNMSLESLIDSYGYVTVLIGTFLEGETVLILGGIAAKLGYLDLAAVILCAFCGTLFGDQLVFLLGRKYGGALLRRRPSWNARLEKVDALLQRHKTGIMIGFRFLYGLRIVTPFAIGMSRIPYAQFVVLNALGAALWATGIGILGYAFGRALELVLGNIRHFELEIMATIVVLGAVIWATHLWRAERN